MIDPAAHLRFFATAPMGMEGLLAAELRELGAGGVAETRAGVAFEGPLETGYRACLWSRVANRVLLRLATFAAHDADGLNAGASAIDWSRHLAVSGTLAVDVTLAGGQKELTHSRYAAQRVKDAIVDQFRERQGARPNVDVARPDVRVNVHAEKGEATVSIDLSGESLHRRGYREEGAQVEAPLKENLAAAVLLRAGWPVVAAGGGSLVDPLCGSGTLPIEAAWMAGDVAPGLLRADAEGAAAAAEAATPDGAASEAAGRAGFGFTRWLQHDEALWARLVDEARQRRDAGLARLLTRADPGPQVIVGYDHDRRAISQALGNIARAGLRGFVHVERRELAELAPPSGTREAPGLVVANPPYGERLGDTAAEIVTLYSELGDRLRAGFAGWRAAVLVGDREHGRLLGLRADKLNTLYNGALQVTLLQFAVTEEKVVYGGGPGARAAAAARAARKPAEIAEGGPAGAAEPADEASLEPALAAPAPAAADQFANRLRKNLRHIGRMMRRQDVTCYRLYDADLPDYAFAVDVYEQWVHVQEYAPPAEIEPHRAQARLNDALRIIPQVLELPPANVHLKVRQRQRGAAQYARQDARGRFFTVHEDDLRYLVNLTDYLDTGLFLDARLTRALIREAAKGQSFLNLFAYTGTASVAAARGKAASTTSVDLSQPYLDWARRNLEVNHLHTDRNHLIRADALEWITRAHDGKADSPGVYDLIYLDPPTFSNSKRMGRATFDVLRDYPDLIRLVMRRLLAPGGVLWFASNARRFKMDAAALPGLVLRDLSKQTLPPDFARSARMHHLWQIEREEDQVE